MALSKNNPALRDNQKLVVYCPTCKDKDGNFKIDMALVKRIPGGMFYVCPKCGGAHPVAKGSYKNLPHEWRNKKK